MFWYWRRIQVSLYQNNYLGNKLVISINVDFFSVSGCSDTLFLYLILYLNLKKGLCWVNEKIIYV